VDARLSRVAWPRHRAAAIALVAAGSLVLLAAILAIWAERNALDRERVAAHAERIVADDAVQAVLAERLAEEVGRLRPELAPAVPVMEAVAERVVATRAFSEQVGDAVARAHALVFDGEVRIGDVEVVVEAGAIRGRLARADSPLAGEVPPGADATILEIEDVGGGLSAARTAGHVVDELAIALPLLALALLGLGVAVAPDRLRALGWAGAGIAAVAGVLVAAEIVGRGLAVRAAEGPVGHDAADAAIGEFTRPLRHGALLLAGVGLVLLAASRGLGARGAAAAAPALAGLRDRALALRDRAPGAEAAAAGALVVAGVLLVLLRNVLVPLLIALAGLALAYLGVARLFALARRGEGAERAAGAAAIGVAVALAAGGVLLLLG
jgi:hypothetical protein